jgi:hypothetical protein
MLFVIFSSHARQLRSQAETASAENIYADPAPGGAAVLIASQVQDWALPVTAIGFMLLCSAPSFTDATS